MAEELLSLKWNNHQSHFVDILSYLREQEIFIDASIACGGKVYQAHKFVLSTCSEYFKQMFAVNKSPHPIVFMKDVSCKDIEALLDFMYHGEVNVPQSSLGSLIKTAEGLQIKGLAVPDDPPSNKRERDGSSTLGSPPSKKPMREKSPPNRYNKVSSQNNLSSKSSSSRPKSPSDSSSRNDKDRLKNSNERTSLSSLEGEPPSTRHSKVELPDKDPSEPSSAIASEEDNSTDNNNSDGTSAQPTKMLHPSKQEEVEIKQEEDIVQLDDEDEGLDPSDDWMGHHNENSLGSENNSTMFAPDLLMHDVDAVMGGAGASSNQANNMAGTSQGTDSAMDASPTISTTANWPSGEAAVTSYACDALASPPSVQWAKENPSSVGSLVEQSIQMLVQRQKDLAAASTSRNRFSSPSALSFYTGMRQPRYRSPNDNAERPFHCSYCSHRFKSKNNLRQHERLHTGERPYVCTICNDSFVQMSSLQHHKSKKHGLSPLVKNSLNYNTSPMEEHYPS